VRLFFAREVDRGDDVGDTVHRTMSAGVLVDDGIVDLARVVVAGIGWKGELSAE
jgi:hypothetical protein